MSGKSKGSGDSSEKEAERVVRMDGDNGADDSAENEPVDLSQFGTAVDFGNSDQGYASAADLLQREFSNLPSEQLRSTLKDLEPLDANTFGSPVDLSQVSGNAWDAIKDNPSFLETANSLLLQDDLQRETDYWKDLLKDDQTKFNLTLKSGPSFTDWVQENRDAPNVDWDEILKGSKSLNLDSLAHATATAARYIHFFDELDEDKRYLTLSDDGVLRLPNVELVEVEKTYEVDETQEESGEEVVELRPHLAVLSRQTQSLPLGLLRVAIADTGSSLEQYGFQIGSLPDPAARAVIQCIVDERVRQESVDLKWRLALLGAGAVIVAAIIGAIALF